MKFDEETGRLIFYSGRKLYVPKGIVGLYRNGGDWIITEGWSANLAVGMKDIKECYTKAELVELAQYVWNEWHSFLKEMGAVKKVV